jgi:hypothetical protein
LGFATFTSAHKDAVRSFAERLKARWSELHPHTEMGMGPIIMAGEWPYGKVMGMMGEGEGIVWTPSGTSGLLNTSDFWLKIKGEQFFKPWRTPRPPPDRSNQFEMCKSFATAKYTIARMEQAGAYLFEMGIPQDVKATGGYLEWLWKDIELEEKTEIDESGIGKGWKSEMVKLAKG